MTPLPRLTDETAFFWTSGEDGVLRVLRCGDCGTWVHPPSPRCPRCLSAAVAPQPTSGRGTVHSFTVNHQPWFGDLDVPYVLAIVQLDDDPALRLTTRLVGVDADADAGLDRADVDGVSTYPGAFEEPPGFSPVGVRHLHDALRLDLSWFQSGEESAGSSARS